MFAIDPSVQLSETEQQEARQIDGPPSPIQLARLLQIMLGHISFEKEVAMLNNAARSFFIALASTAIALMVTAMATSAAPALARAPFAPAAFVSVI